jgi:hypothetical protein
MASARDRFKRKLTAARQKSWDRFVQQDLAEIPWGVTYKLAPEKFHKSGVISCFTRDDETLALRPHETLEYLLHKLLECISTRGTQAWLPRCARYRGRATQKRVHWRSPVLFLFLLSQHRKYQIFTTQIRSRVV